MDPVLRCFVDTTDDAEAERHLNALVEQHALPLAKAIVGRKLRQYKEDRSGRSHVHDQDDVIADAMVTLIERLQAARVGTENAPIENFVNYAAAVIHSACAHHFRRRYPERARLKDRLRYVFSTERRLALWTTAEDELACGLVEWRGRPIEPSANHIVCGLADRAERRWAAMSRAELAATAVELVTSAGGSVDFEIFVGAAASAVGVVEPRENGDPLTLAAVGPAPDVVIDQRRHLARAWEEIGQLPVRQRIALLLNLRNPAGAGLLWLLPVVGVATIRQIARLLEIPDVEFARLWHQIPIDDAMIAQRLGCTRQQVINLRMAARKRLMTRVEGVASVPAPRGRQANLRRVSASLKGSA